MITTLQLKYSKYVNGELPTGYKVYIITENRECFAITTHDFHVGNDTAERLLDLFDSENTIGLPDVTVSDEPILDARRMSRHDVDDDVVTYCYMRTAFKFCRPGLLRVFGEVPENIWFKPL